MKRPDVYLRNKKARGNRYKGYSMLARIGQNKQVKCWFLKDGQRTRYRATIGLLSIWATLLLLATSCIPLTFTDGRIVISHSGLDIKGGCEDFVAFIMDVGPTQFRTPFWRYDCQYAEPEFDLRDQWPYGLHEVKVTAFDDSGNISPITRSFGCFYKTGYDSSFSVRRDGTWLTFDRTWPNTIRPEASFAEVAWYDDAHVWHDWTAIPYALSIEELQEITGANVVHVRMNGFSGDRWFPTKERVVQLSPFWVGELE